MVQLLSSFSAAHFAAMSSHCGHYYGHSHGHGDPMVLLAIYIVLTLLTLPAGIIFIFKHKCKFFHSDSAYIDLGGAAFIIIQVLMIITLLIYFFHQLIS